MELFVDDLDASVAFYTAVLGFRVVRREHDYVSLRHGAVVLGLGPVAKLPQDAVAPAFSRQRLREGKGAGVEIVLELDDLAQLSAAHESCQAHGVVIDALRPRPWGLQDFRLADPDGYYLRLTHDDATIDDTPATA